MRSCRRSRSGAGSGLEVELLNRHHPVPLDEGLRSLLKEVASDQGLATLDMPSGAGHDSEIFAERVPTAMIFVPSQDGKSHRPDEYTPLEQVLPGVSVLAETLYRLAYAEPEGTPAPNRAALTPRAGPGGSGSRSGDRWLAPGLRARP